MSQERYKYFAFISYNSKDTAWGKRVQKKLEHYRMPSTLCSKHGWRRKPLKPIFFAPTDIQPGGLTTELQERLKASRNLIVICSPNSAKSKWVGKEIEYFHSLGRTNNIHFFIVDGVPHSGNEETECFNPIVDTLGLPEILGANIHEKVSRWPWINKERAFVQLITKLLGVEFDSIWQRHKRKLYRMIVTDTIILIFALIIAYWFMTPISLVVNVSAIKTSLPEMIEGKLCVNGGEYSFTNTDTTITIDDIPGYMRLRTILIDFSADRYYQPKHNELCLNANVTQSCDFIIERDSTFAVFAGYVFKETSTGGISPLEDAIVKIENKHTRTDINGYFRLAFNVSEQTTTKAISIEKDGYKKIERKEECPSAELKYIIHQ